VCNQLNILIEQSETTNYTFNIEAVAANSHLQAICYIHLIDLHNEYVRAMSSHVTSHYFGNICNECSRVAVLLD
jgi:hypothetical protein